MEKVSTPKRLARLTPSLRIGTRVMKKTPSASAARISSKSASSIGPQPLARGKPQTV